MLATRSAGQCGGAFTQSRPDMTSKKPAPQNRRKAAPAVEHATSLAMVITQNLANMATVFASSGSVLLCLLIAKRF
ncbi:hypothetical protein RPD_1056 [Rhodopseudomonas palustris BisB5]|uniref:Uncharacterized protein n=2 Tax=Rhodopseudomonas TaxID=1073 RepID=Q13C95_RHOPS|nr:hypothetical protein RPD_1056 [Rhodopseudomonas palustris BisB5]